MTKISGQHVHIDMLQPCRAKTHVFAGRVSACRNFLAPGQNQSAPKTVPELWQFWDGALLTPAVLGWHKIKVHLQYFTCQICHALAPSHQQYFTSPDVRWHLRHLENVFYRQICDSTLLTCNILPPVCAMAPSHLQYFTARCAMAPSHLQYFTARFAMAPYHLEHAFYRQICDSTFSP